MRSMHAHGQRSTVFPPLRLAETEGLLFLSFGAFDEVDLTIACSSVLLCRVAATCSCCVGGR